MRGRPREVRRNIGTGPHLPGDLVVSVEVDGQRRLADDRLHAGDPEAVVVVGVVEPRVDHPLLAEAVDLLVDERAHLAVADGAREAAALQVDHLQHAGRLVVAEGDGGAVVHDLRQLGQLAVLVEDAAARAQVVRGVGPAVLGEVVDDGRVALRRVVGVADVADGHVREHGVPRHAGHGDGRDPTRGVELEDVLPLALQQQHHGLEAQRETQSRTALSTDY